MKLSIPYISEPILLNAAGEVLLMPHGSFRLTDVQNYILQRVIEGGYTVHDLVRLFSRAYQSDGARVTTLISNFLSQLPCTAIAELDIPVPIDAVFVDRGWGGVSRHALDMWEALNRECRVLFVCAERPSYGFDKKLSNLLITPETCANGTASLISFVCIVRSILKKLSYRLLLFTHCSMTPYCFDVAAERPTITFGDGYGEASLLVGKHLAPNPPSNLPLFLQELFYGSQEPWNSIAIAKAYYWAFKYATENWLWTGSQLEEVQRCFPELSSKFRLVLPFVDADSFVPCDRDPIDSRILFTTTSQKLKVGLKGLDPLLHVFDRLPLSAGLLIVLDDASYAPTELRKWGSRIQVLAGVPKAAMRGLYQSAIVNCRISKEDSAPVSVLESMACGLPVIVSPIVAKNIPIIMDGITGYVVEPDDVEGLERILCGLLSDRQLQRRIGSAGRRAVLRHSLSNNLSQITRYLYNGDCRGCD